MKNITFLVSILLITSFGNQGGQETQSAETNENIDWVENNMVFIPAGEFHMGSDNQQEYEKPSHKVILDAFYMDKTEVTQQEFVSLMGRNPAHCRR